MTHSRRISFAPLLAAALAACSAPAPTPTTCGTGTHLEGTQCLPGPGIPTACGAGTHLEGTACLADPPANVVTCGEGTHLVGSACLPSSTLTCGEGTHEVGGDCVPSALEPGRFENPIVLLKDAQGLQNHMHVNEMRYRAIDGKVIYCSYTFGVMDGNNPDSMTYLAQNLKHVVPGTKKAATGACLHLAVDTNDKDIVYVTHRGNIDNEPVLTGWNLRQDAANATKLNPVQLPVLQEPGVSYEGIDTANGHVFVALRGDGLGVYDRNPADNTLHRIGTLGGFQNAFQVRVRGNTAYVADSLGGLVIVDVTDAAHPALLGKIDVHGTARDVAFDGDTAYVAAGAKGVVAVNVKDPAHPAILGTTDTPGMALQVAFDAGRLSVADWGDTRVYDAANPAALKFLAAARATFDLGYPEDDRPAVTDRVMGIAMHGDVVYSGVWHFPRSYRIHADRRAPNIVLPEELNLLDFGDLAVGQAKSVPVEVSNQGTAPLTVYEAWADDPAFTVTPAQLLVPPGGKGAFTVTYTAGKTDKQTAILNLFSDDPAQPLRQGFLVGNMTGLGVGVALPQTKIALTDGGEWDSSSPDVQGHVTLLAFFSTFCPVCGAELPDMEEQFWLPYKSRGLQVAAADCGGIGGFGGGAYTDDMPGLQDYVDNLHVTYPIGLQDATTRTYNALASNYQGANPFPIDVIVDKHGIIRYVAREHDPAAMTQLIEQLLDEP